MPFGSGLDGQIGLKAESGSYGTYIAPTAFLEVESEGLEPDVQSLESFPLTGGLYARTGRHVDKVIGAKGPLKMTVLNLGMLQAFKAALGSGSSTRVGATAEYHHDFIPDITTGMKGLFHTVQVGRPSTDGTVRPFNHLGGKVTGWELSAGQNELLKFSTDWDFKTVETSSTLATASYAASAKPYSSLDATVSIGGASQTTLSSISIKGAAALNTGRFGVGGVKLEPLANGEWEVTGEFAGEFTDLTLFNAWIAGTEATNLIVTFTGGTIPTTTNPFKITLTIPALRYTGSAPKLEGPDVLSQSLPFKALYNGTDPIVKIVVNSNEVSI